MKGLLVLMAKQPALAQTKTRLMPLLSAEQAAELYHCFLLDKLEQMRQVRDVTLAIAYTPAEARSFFADLAPNFSLMLQRGDDLGQRLQEVFKDAFAAGYEQVVAIDSDTVTLPPDYLQQAFEGLADADVTLGGCEDGGYYAIGMKQLQPTLFEVEMSTSHVLNDTLQKAEAAGLSVHLLPTWYDVDTPADLQRLAVDLKNSDTPTACYLQALER